MILVHMRFFRFLYQVLFKYLTRFLLPFGYTPPKLQTPNPREQQPTKYLFYRRNKFCEPLVEATREASTRALLLTCKGVSATH